MSPSDAAVFEALLARCTGEGVITPAQAEQLRAELGAELSGDSSGDRPQPVGRPWVVEAMGYLGGAIALAGSLLVGARYWDHLGTAWRLVVLGCGVAVPLVAGGVVLAARLAVPVDMGRRLRAVLWLVSLGFLVGFLVVLEDRVLELRGADARLFVAGVTAACASVLWWRHRVAAQEVAMMLALAATAALALNRFLGGDDLPGLAVWVVGLLWIAQGAAAGSPRRASRSCSVRR